jgi:hypothetical protein
MAGTIQGQCERLSVRVVKHKEGLVQQEEKYLSRQFKFELPPSDSYRSHWVVTFLKDRLGVASPRRFAFQGETFHSEVPFERPAYEEACQSLMMEDV